MIGPERLDQERLLTDAISIAGSDDLGEPTWGEGLAVLLDSLAGEAQLNDIGVEVVAIELTAYLANRLAITAWRREHQMVAKGTVTGPIVIVGQPRTGTTILFDLLAQDPELRAPLTWEVDRPVPAPTAATYLDDPRIAEVQATIELADSLIPGFTTFHPMGARLGQECVRITGSEFRSMIFPTQYRIPTYNHWLLEEADLSPAYRWHRRFLQHLQSDNPVGQWLLKSPAHLWHLDALAAEYPDAIIVQTHRDPLVVVASVSALVAHLRRLASDNVSLTEIAADYADDIFLGLERGVNSRQQGAFPADQIIDVQYGTFRVDPLAAIASIYSAMRRELTSATEQKMRQFLADHPGDGGGGGSRYRFSNTGLDQRVLRARAESYQATYGVPSETLS
jgi:Sulfotransferase family